jgi:serine protease
MPTAWDIASGNSDLRVAVIDTGLLVNHPDLANMFSQGGGYDMISSTTVANDGDGRDSNPSDPGDWAAAGDCGVGKLARNYYRPRGAASRVRAIASR